MSHAQRRRVADVPFEEDVLTEITQKVVEVINMYEESYDNVTVPDKSAMRSRAATFVTEVIEYIQGSKELVTRIIRALSSYQRAVRQNASKGLLRQKALQVMNAAHNYAWQFYANDDSPNVDDLIDAKINEAVRESGGDVEELNALIDSIY
jgi:hypothetical protein